MSLTAFEERQYLKWGDFLNEIKEQNKKDIENDKKYALSKEERSYVLKQISYGNDLQERLNQKWNDKDYLSYGAYLKYINRHIAIQDTIITNIMEYLAEIKKFKDKK